MSPPLRARFLVPIGALATIALGIGCAPAPPPPSVTQEIASGPCVAADVLRGRVEALRATGRLDRARRSLARADELCPANAREWRATRVEVLQELGAKDELASLGASTEFADRAPHSIAEARALVDEAVALLGEAGPSAPRPATAQRLFDRALLGLERETGAAASLSFPNGLPADVNAVAWSRADALAVAYGDEVSVYAGNTMREIVHVMASAGVDVVALTPDGATLATASTHGPEVRLWDANTGRPLRALVGHAKGILAVSFSEDGAHVATAGADETVRVWDVSTGSESSKRDVGAPMGVALSPDGARVAWWSKDGTTFGTTWLATSGSADEPLRFTDATCAAFTPDGEQIAFGTASGYRVTDASATTVLATTHLGREVGAIAISRGGRTLGTWTRDGSIGFQPREESGAWREIGRSGPRPTLAMSPDGEVLAWGRGTNVLQIHGPSGVDRGGLKRSAAPVSVVRFSPDGAWLASGDPDGQLRVWDARHGADAGRSAHAEGAIVDLAFSPDGKQILTAGKGRVRFEVATGATKIENGAPYAVAWSPSGALVAEAADGELVLTEAATGARVRRVEAPGRTFEALAFSPDGKLLAATAKNAGIVRAWEVATGAPFTTLEAAGATGALAFSPSGDTLGWAAGDALEQRAVARGTRSVIDPKSGSIDAIAYADADRLDVVATGGSDGKTRLWNARTGAQITVVSAADAVTSLAFSAGGALLATASRDGAITLYRSPVYAPIATLRGRFLGQYVLSPDGYIDTNGAAADWLLAYAACRVGSVSLPFAACRERFEVRGLLGHLLAGSTDYRLP